MPSKGMDSDSDSGEDYYDDFSKYKKKHMIVKEFSSYNLAALECTSNDENLQKLSKNTIAKGNPNISKQAVSPKQKNEQKGTKVKPSNATSELYELDEELAELLDSPPASLVSTLPVVARKCDNKLENILLATKSILDDTQFYDRPDSENEVPASSADDSINLEQRCTIVMRLNGQSIIVRCNMDDQFNKIVKENAAQLNMEANKVILMGKDCRLYFEQTPRSVGFDVENLNEIDVFEDCDATNDMVTIKWLMKGKRPITAKILPQQAFQDLKKSFCTEHGLDLKKTRLVFDAENLSDSDTPEALGIEEGDCIDVYMDE